MDELLELLENAQADILSSDLENLEDALQEILMLYPELRELCRHRALLEGILKHCRS